MLQILNRTGLKTAITLLIDPLGHEKVCVVAKGTFTIPGPGKEAQLAEEQIEPLHADAYHGEPGASSIKYPADLISGKLGTDVLLVGSAKLPGSRPVRRLEASFRVGSLGKRVVVSGDRLWEKQPFGPGFQMTEPEVFSEMPLVYERAFGGRDPAASDSNTAWDTRNPVGRGFRVTRDSVDGTAVPNIEDRDHRISSWDDKPPVAGFGAIDGLWEPRRIFAGTYDEDWQANQAPLLPTDFDLRFFNVAAPGFTATGFLRGSESVELVNVGEANPIVFGMPIADVSLAWRVGDTVSRQRADLWTVLFEPDHRRFSMTWGNSFAIGKQPSRAYGVEVTVEGPMARQLAVSGVA